MAEVDYGVTGDEITVSVDGETYRAYSFNISRGASTVEARAFEDPAAFSPVVMTSKTRDIELSFRKPPVAPMNTTVLISIQVNGGTATLYKAKVVSKVKTGTVDGAVDYSFTARVLPEDPV